MPNNKKVCFFRGFFGTTNISTQKPYKKRKNLVANYASYIHFPIGESSDNASHNALTSF